MVNENITLGDENKYMEPPGSRGTLHILFRPHHFNNCTPEMS